MATVFATLRLFKTDDGGKSTGTHIDEYTPRGQKLAPAASALPLTKPQI